MHVHTSTYAFDHTCGNVCMWECVHVGMCACVSVCVDMFICVYICKYVNV